MQPLKKIIVLSSLALISLQASKPLYVYKDLGEELFLMDVDEIKQLCIAYHDFGESYTPIISQTVFAIGYNKDFIIAKRHPSDWDTPINKKITEYYIIDLRKIKEDKRNFISDTTILQYVYKDINDKDSLGPKINYISSYSPQEPKALTIEEFKLKRKELNIPDTLDFTIVYKDL